ncbi:hypothetical protein BD324DRAFT_445709 [Kockovaella imperatae]|uniref:Uncharacterized protein n=1 Tax=Kockovaella imperatae TaxID=4999 RepID=A0A1Y1UH51_9TREE|nr:hypothetical protein BD324DRAFT_445709 [Kockovaella imperatae]ORX37380.1 hypothetical protein BD324DRAFT_445709 [Kockovaella imperatae]
MAGEQSDAAGRMNDRCNRLRDEVLALSGGWLGEGVILISDLLGVWDIFVLSAIFVLSWVIMRTAMKEITLCIGLVFDLGIPLQYVCDDVSAAFHKPHLERYWPIFVIGSLLEVAMFFISHPDLFTLVVCLKTLACTFFWLSRRPSGEKITLGSSISPSGSSVPAGPQAPSAPKPSSIPSSTFIVDPRIPDADARLQAAGYTDPDARRGLILSLINTSNDQPDSRAETNLRRWTKDNAPKQVAKRTATYSKKWRDHLASLGTQAAASSATPNAKYRISSSQLTPLNESLRTKLDRPTRQKLMAMLKSSRSNEETEQILKGFGNDVGHSRGLGGEGGGGGARASSSGQPSRSRPSPAPPPSAPGTISAQYVLDAARAALASSNGDLAREAMHIAGPEGLGLNIYTQRSMATRIGQLPRDKAKATIQQWRQLAAMPNNQQKINATIALTKQFDLPEAEDYYRMGIAERAAGKQAKKERTKARDPP